jgi:hypothetical protein
MRIRQWALALTGCTIAVMLTLTGGPAQAARPPAGPVTAAAASGTAEPRPDHVVVLSLENHSAASIIGNPDAPYINALASSGANMTQSFAVTHPSQPNYIALFSGSLNGVTDNTCPHTLGMDNLGAQLGAAGLGFAGYSEDLPSVGFTGCGSGAYARKHNPWVNFTNVPATANLPLTSFPTDYSTLPAVSFVVPNLNNDMHDGSIGQGDSWIRDHLDGYVQWAQQHNSVFVLTFDEDDNKAGNQIATLILGQRVQPAVGPGHELAQPAVGGAVPGEVHAGAQVLQPCAALAAHAAGQRRVQADAAALQRAGHDHAGHLVTEHERLVERGVPDRARGEPVQVGPAQTA